MKKWLSLVMVLVMLECVTACGANPDDTENGTTTTQNNKTDDTTMTDDEARNLCVAKMQQAYQIEVWYLSLDNFLDLEMLPEGTAATYLDGTPYTLDYVYYRLADSLPEADRSLTTTAAALKQYIETVYTVDAIANRYYASSTWVVYQGEVYRVAAEGMWHHRSLDTIRVTHKETDAITFTIDGLENEPTEEHTLRYIDGNWKFDEFGITILM